MSVLLSNLIILVSSDTWELKCITDVLLLKLMCSYWFHVEVNDYISACTAAIHLANFFKLIL